MNGDTRHVDVQVEIRGNPNLRAIRRAQDGHPLYIPLPLNQSFLEEQLERELTDAGITG